MTDLNQAVIDYLITCPIFKNNPLFFNAIEAKDENKQIVTTANNKKLQKPYIDGSVLKRFTFTIIDFRSITYQPIVKIPGDAYKNENVQDMLDVQSIIDWIDEQQELCNFPDFGENCIVESIKALSENPNLNGIDTSSTPSLAKYSISIQIDYIDNSKTIWR